MSRGQARELALVTRIDDGYLIQTRTAVRFAASIDAMLAIVREVSSNPVPTPDREVAADREELKRMMEGM